MPSSTNKSLFLQVGADITSLQTQMKAGRTAILALADTAGDVQQEVQKALANFSTDPSSLKQLEASYKATFDNIRQTAQAALAVNDNASALKLIDATGAKEAAAAAAAQAAELRIAADAAAAVARREDEAGLAARALAVSLEIQAVEAAKVSQALSAQAGVMTEVAAEARLLGAREDEVTGAHTRMGSSGLITEHVVRSLSDSIAAGQSPVRALTMEMGRITEAMTLYAATTNATEGKMAAFANFMGGPWGIAISVGAAVLTPLIADLIEAGDKVGEETNKLKQNAEQTAIAEKAKKAFAITEAGIIDDVRSITEELKKQNDALKTNAELLNVRSKKDLQGAQTDRSKVAKDLVTARAKLSDLQGGDTTSQSSLSAVGAAQARVEDLEKRLKALDASIASDKVAVLATRADLADEAAKRAADPLLQIKYKYEGADGLIQQAKKRAIAEGAVTTVLTAQLKTLREQQDAETKAEQQRQRDENRSYNNTDVGRTVTLAEAEDIVQGVGGRVTSARRSRAQQQVLYDRYQAGTGPLAAKPGTSLHESGQALDVAKTAGVTLGILKEAFKEAGVHLTEALDEGDHYHVGFGKKGPRGPSAETLAKRQQAQVNRTANDDRGFQNAERQADDAIAKAKLQLGGSLEDQYKIRLDQIASDLYQKNQGLQNEVTAKRLTQTRADELKIKNAQLADLDEQQAAEQYRVAEANIAYEDDKDARTARLALLQIDAGLATTRAARLKIERQILEEQQAQRRSDLNHTVDVSKPGAPEQQRAQDAIGRVPAQETAENKQFKEQHLDQLDTYKKKLHDDTDDMNEALDDVEAKGLQGLQDGLTGIISGTESVGSAFKKMANSIISDIERIAIEKAIVSILGLKDGGKTDGFSLGGLPGFAGGSDPFVASGLIHGEGTGTSDSILAIVGGRKPIRISNGEAIVNARGVQKHWPLIDAINHDRLPGFADGGAPGSLPDLPTSYPALPSGRALTIQQAPPVQYLHFDFKGAVVTQDLINDATQKAATAYAESVKHTNRSIAGLSRRTI